MIMRNLRKGKKESFENIRKKRKKRGKKTFRGNRKHLPAVIAADLDLWSHATGHIERLMVHDLCGLISGGPMQRDYLQFMY